jgi:hypothetical protein
MIWGSDDVMTLFGAIAAYVRRAIRKVLPVRRDRPWMRHAGLVESGDCRSSQTIDDIVYGAKN